MWLILLISYCLCRLSQASSWFPVANPMLGEQIDLVGSANDTLVSTWKKVSENDQTKDTFDILDATAEFNSTQIPVDSMERDRDREPLDDVEHIEPRQWPARPDVLYTRTVLPSTTETTVRHPLKPPILAHGNSSTQRYPPVTVPPPTASVDEVFCDFGSFPTPTLCEWQNGDGISDWLAGTGMGTNWMGGPPSDYTTATMEGGYAFLETSQLPQKDVKGKSLGGLLHSPQLGNTGVSGTCIIFKYIMDGLSASGLRVLLHAGNDQYSLKNDQIEEISPVNATVSSCKPIDIVDERVIWNAQYYTLGAWQQTQILYTYPQLHSLILEGLPVDSADPARYYRGYIAVDDIDLQPGTSCIGFCNFAAGFCDWANDAEDDFDWTISRGSGNPTTGPAMDSSADRATAGGYAYIDSSYPRRPGDRARLISASFPAPSADAPMCMHFWFHMFGSGIGTLKLFIRHFRSLDAPLREIWSVNGNAGNTWFVAQITISSPDDFQLLFEASVGNTGMGDIAIDDISFAQGPCPVLPQVAAPTPRDCTFEIDECDWINSRDPDRVEWERVSVQELSPRNQRKPYSNGYTINRRNEYFLALARSRGHRSSGGGTAQLVSREIKATREPVCITFWYLMFESFIDPTGPSLGILRVSVQTNDESSGGSRPIWQLYNNQGPTWNYAQINVNERKDFNVVFEGTWGPNRASGSIAIDDIAFYTGNCSVKPAGASVRPEDCSFEKGLCGWENITSSDNDRLVTWQRAFLAHRPAQLLDKTFGATGDFVFFDIFTTNKQSTDVRLRSPVIQTSPDEQSMCFTFWFAAFGVEESTTLQVLQMNADEESSDEENDGKEDQQPLWSLTAKGFNNPRPVWTAAQVTIDARAPFRLVLRGSASNGGFAIDDIKFQSQPCSIRPAAAQPTKNGS